MITKNYILPVLLTSTLLIAGQSLHAQQAAAITGDELAGLKAEIERLKGMVPDQSHAMKDVAYHFTNLWFAAEKKNWPLAQFYLAETQSHLRWAVRIIPVRKTLDGHDLRLADILEPMEKLIFKELQASVTAKDPTGFATQYGNTLNACYSCHVAAGKPFLRLQIPKQPEVSVIHFEPEP